jgi:Reverse transcriptase (RNA-dependent DNA polymerase)
LATFLAPWLAEAANTSRDGSILTPSQQLSYIRLLHKRGARSDLHNWRPIALTNTDAKIVTRALDSRLRTVLPTLIHPDQTGFVPDRSIDSPILRAQALFGFNYPIYTWAYASDNFPLERQGFFVSMDFTSAYDRVSRVWLARVLSKTDLGPRFTSRLLSTLVGLASSVCLNGWLSHTFPTPSGVRRAIPYRRRSSRCP